MRNNKDLLIGEYHLKAVDHLHPRYGSWTAYAPPPRLTKVIKWGLSGNPARMRRQLSKDLMLQDTQKGDGITSSPRCSEESSRLLGEEQFTDAPSRWAPSPCTCHQWRGWRPQVEACSPKIKQPETRKSDRLIQLKYEPYLSSLVTSPCHGD